MICQNDLYLNPRISSKLKKVFFSYNPQPTLPPSTHCSFISLFTYARRSLKPPNFPELHLPKPRYLSKSENMFVHLQTTAALQPSTHCFLSPCSLTPNIYYNLLICQTDVYFNAQGSTQNQKLGCSVTTKLATFACVEGCIAGAPTCFIIIIIIIFIIIIIIIIFIIIIVILSYLLFSAMTSKCNYRCSK